MQALLVLAIVLGGLGTVLGGLSVILHAIAPRTKSTFDDRAAAAVDKLHAGVDAALAKLKAIAGPATLLVLLVVLPASALGVVACSSTQRQDTLHYAMTGIDTAAATLQAYGPPHELALVTQATTKDAATKAVADWQQHRHDLELAIAAAYRACEVAAAADDQGTLAAATTAAKAVADQLAALGIGGGK